MPTDLVLTQADIDAGLDAPLYSVKNKNLWNLCSGGFCSASAVNSQMVIRTLASRLADLRVRTQRQFPGVIPAWYVGSMSAMMLPASAEAIQDVLAEQTAELHGDLSYVVGSGSILLWECALCWNNGGVEIPTAVRTYYRLANNTAYYSDTIRANTEVLRQAGYNPRHAGLLGLCSNCYGKVCGICGRKLSLGKFQPRRLNAFRSTTGATRCEACISQWITEVKPPVFKRDELIRLSKKGLE